MTDITELAQDWKAAAHKAKQANDLYLEGKITLSECVVETKDYLDYSDNPNNFLALLEALEKAQTENTAGAAGMAESYETTISMLSSRIASLEESHAQVIQSRDHYERMLEEGLEQLAEPRTVTVKLPQAVSAGGQGYQEQVERILTAAGIKWEAE
nr:MAG TPA: hypothetical protein [Caudoviricetes sp.]